MRSALPLPTAFAALVLVMSTGCGSADKADGTGPAPTDPVILDASPETRGELGVVRWGISDDGEQTDVHAYGAHGETLAVLHGTSDVAPDGRSPRSVDVTLSGPDLDARMHVDAADGASPSVVANTFADGSNAARVLARLQADIPDAPQAAAPTATTGGSSLLQSSNLHIQDKLVDTNCQVLTNCTNLITQKAAGYAALAKSCTLTIDPSWSADIQQQAKNLCSDTLDHYQNLGVLDGAATQKCKDAASAAFNKCGGSSPQ